MAKNYSRRQGNRGNQGSKKDNKKVVISYIYLDRAQGQNFEIWDKTKGRLLRWGNIVQRLNTLTTEQALRQVVVKYTDKGKFDSHNMPKKSKWSYPRTLNNKEVTWCKIVVMNQVRVIGFMEDNVFYVVFLDEKHEFYPTEP